MSDHYRQRPVDLALLRAHATLTATAPLAAAELAAALDVPTHAITSKLQALVRTELAARSRKAHRAATRVYQVTEDGRELLRRTEASRIAKHHPLPPAPTAG